MSSTEIVDGLAPVARASTGIDAICADLAKRHSDGMVRPNVSASRRLTGAAAPEWDEWKSVRDVG